MLFQYIFYNIFIENISLLVILHVFDILVQVLHDVFKFENILLKVLLVLRWDFRIHENVSLVVQSLTLNIYWLTQFNLLRFINCLCLWIIILSTTWPLPFRPSDSFLLLTRNFYRIIINLLILIDFVVFIFDKILPVFLHLLSEWRVFFFNLLVGLIVFRRRTFTSWIFI